MVNHNPSEENAKEFNKFADPKYVGTSRPPRRYKGSSVLIFVLVVGLSIFGFLTVKKQLAARDSILSSTSLSSISHPPKIDWLTSVFVSQNLHVGNGAQVDLIHISSFYDSFGSSAGTIGFTTDGITFSKMVNAKPSQVGSTNALSTGPGMYAINTLKDKDLVTGIKFGVKVNGYYYPGSNQVADQTGVKSPKPIWCFIVSKDGVSSKWTSAVNGMEYMQIGGKPLTCEPVK